MPGNDGGADRLAEIRRLGSSDLAFAARLHVEALPHGFFPRLGVGFMRAYYRSFQTSPYAVALVSTVDGDRAGVLVGTVDDDSHYKFMARRPWLLAPAALAALIVRPRLAGWFLRTRLRRYARGVVRIVRSSTPAPNGASPAASGRGVLTHLAVLEEHRSSGVGRALVHEFVRQATAAGATQLDVTTRADGGGAAGFYEALGWERVATRRDADQQAWLDLRLVLG